MTYREHLLVRMKDVISDWWPERHDSELRRYGLRELIRHTRRIRDAMR